MVRQFLFTIILYYILVVFGQQASVAAEDKPAISNIGFVLYSKSLAPGTLNVRWMLTDKYKGPGIATGGPEQGYAGSYHVRYFYDSGEFSDEYDLILEKSDHVYTA